MLKSLQVINFALIEGVTIEFGNGLTVLTGETGAGKSIIIDALNIVIGGRASSEAIRSGCEFFRVEGVFDIAAAPSIKQLFEECDITQEDDKLIISRRLNRSGKNTIVINGCQVPLTVLSKLGEYLVDMHGQHENQALLRPESHLLFLDSFDPRIGDVLAKYRKEWNQWQQVKHELAQLLQNTRDREQRIDMLSWQVQEIAAANLKIGEEEKAEAETRVLANAEKITKALEKAYHLLQSGGKGSIGVLSALTEVRKELEIVSRYDNSLNNALQVIQDAWYQLEDAASEISSYRDTIEYNPNRLEKLQNRLDSIYKLKKKYGSTIDEVLRYEQKAKEELEQIQGTEEKTIELETKKELFQKALFQYSNDLDKLRREAGHNLSQQICLQLADLAIPKARLVFDINKTPDFGPQGANQVTLLFSANLGEELKPLHKIASGGELSRVALAIKTISACHDAVSTMVFDEVDTGIGGQTAQMVAEKVALVARDKQVLSITHLPQMACMADHHYRIAKHTEGERTYTTVHLLTGAERVHEITAMIGGHNITALALENTTQLLIAAKEKKDKWKNRA